MKTLYDYAFPMTDGALSHVDPVELAEAMINHACTYSNGIDEKFRGIPCWVFKELRMGIDLSLSFFLLEFPSQTNGMKLRTNLITQEQAYRLIRMVLHWHQRMGSGYRPENAGTNEEYRK